MNNNRSIQDVLFLIMRVTLIQILIMTVLSTVVCAADVKGQGVLDRKLSLHADNEDISSILSEIENRIGVNFTYVSKTIRASRKISLIVKETRLGDVLRTIFSPEVEYEVVNNGNEIILRSADKRPTGEKDSMYVRGRLELSIGISGLVIDESGLPLAGVNVVEKGGTNGTTTDAKGRFSLEVSDGKASLIFSFVGYISQEVSINQRSTFTISLKSDVKSLNDVIVVGYGERKKENYLGAVSTIQTKDLIAAPEANISNSLVGRLSGLIAVQRNGEPGQDGSQLFIRGVSTTGDNTPLVVIDGIPRTDFSQLDPNEIESVTLLKDPGSAAVFGVRAANGVILITTKRGKPGKPVFSLTARSDWQQPTRLPKYLDSYGYASLMNEGLTNAGKPALYSPADLQKYKDGSDPNAYPNTDWLKSLLKPNAPQQQYNLSMSGGTEKIRYFLSAGAVNQSGLYANSSFKRYNFRSNIDADVTPTTRISMDISGRSENRDAPSDPANQLIYYAVYAPPIFPAYFTNGLPGSFPSGRNPAERAKRGGYNDDINNTLLTNLTVNQKIPFIPGLSVKGVFSYDMNYDNSKIWNTPYKVYLYNASTKDYTAINGDGINTINLAQQYNSSSSVTTELHLNYAKTLGKHEVTALALYSQNHGQYDYLYAYRDNYISTALDQIFAGDDGTQINDGNESKNGREGYVGRVTYSYAGKYLFEANGRYDGSFNFAPGKKWGFFPSVLVGWKISEEKFFRNNIHAFDYLKIRSTYGILGNDRISPYRYLASYQFGAGYVFGDPSSNAVNKGVYSTGVPDPNTTWERAKSINIGFDGSAWKRKLTFEFDYFYKRTSNILGLPTLSVPSTFGETLPLRNIGMVDNRGVELSIGHENQIGNSIHYFIKGNLTYAHNTIVYIDEPATVNPLQKQTGRSINQFFGFKAIGLFNSQQEINSAPVQPTAVAPGDIRYADLNGRDANGNLTGKPDGKIDADDITAIGRTPIPEIIYGLSAGMSYKGFDVNFLFQGATRVNAFVTGELAWPFYNGAKALVDQLNFWTPTHQDAKYPRITDIPTANNTQTSSYWLRDASYLRLKNLELGYSFPARWMSKVGFHTARLFVSGQNLLTFDKLKVIDPEGPGDSGTGFNGNSSRGWFYPQEKVYALGLNLTF